ncbi:MAG: type VI secretion system contractile sheath large subunit [Gemmatimonadetes bacterium]|nr:type VI secretion system contractile sheath large subunit [Gemmatimonadota bacterium]
MSQTPERVRVSLSVDPRERQGSGASEAPPFCVLVLGDFSARGGGSVGEGVPLARRRPVPVRSVEDLLEKLQPTLDFTLEGPGQLRIDVRELDDLHPDRLAERMPHLRSLIEAIEPMVATHRQPRKEDDAGIEAQAATGPDAGAREAVSREGLLDEIIEATPSVEPAPAGGLPELEPWIRSVVAPHLQREETEAQGELRERLEREAAEQVVRVLQAPVVRAFEGLLRSLLLLLSVADPSMGVRVHVLDLTRADLEADLGREDVEESALLRILLEPLPGPCGASSPALLVGAYEFGRSARDIALLNRIAMIAHVVGAPWLSAAAPDLLGGPSFQSLDELDPDAEGTPAIWDAFRVTPAARSVGLASPPFLARLPFGPTTDPCELPFLEEVTHASATEATKTSPDPYVWGNPAFMCAAALASSYQKHAWNLDPTGPAEFDSRPIHVLPGGEVGAHPTAAAWTASTVERVLRRGVMPLVTFPEEARVRIPWIGPVAEPRGSLQAWWSTP